MKIESLIRPTQLRPGQTTLARTVHLFGTAYMFAKTPDDKFVANVEEPRAIECLLKLAKTYRQYVEPAPALARIKIDPADAASVAAAAKQKAELEQAEADQAAAAASAAAKVAEQEANEAATATAEALEAEVQSLLSSTPQAIKKIVEKKVPSAVVLKRAIELEQAQEKPRAQVVNLLTGTLSSIEQPE